MRLLADQVGRCLPATEGPEIKACARCLWRCREVRYPPHFMPEPSFPASGFAGLTMPHIDVSFLGSAGIFWWLALALTVAVGLWAYHRLLAPLGRGLTAFLRAVRIAALILLLAALLEPVLTIERSSAGSPRLAILVDHSSSMRLPGSRDSTREAEAARALEELRATLGDRYDLDVSGFTDHIAPSAASDANADPGGPTALGDVLEEALVRQSQSPAGAIILLSDGINTAGKDPGAIARNLPLPVFSVVLGDTQPPPDILVREVKANPVAYAGEPVAIRVVLSANGIASAGAALTVREMRMKDGAATPGAVVARRELENAGKGGEEEAVLEFTPATAGLALYEVEISTAPISTAPDEAVTINNRRLVALDVRAKKTRVLCFEGEPDWDFTFLKRIFDADTTLAYDYLVRQKDGSFAPYGRGAPGSVPLHPSDLAAYAGIIVSRISPSELPPATVAALRQFVASGGGVLFLDGPLSGAGLEAWHAAGWSELLPVSITPDPRRGFSQSISRTTYAGQAHEITALGESPGETDKFWESLPPVWIREGRYMSAPGAAVLLTGETTQPRAEMPILALSPTGGGRVGVLLARGFWRWDFVPASQSGGDHVAREFWMRLARWLAEPVERERFHLGPMRNVFQDSEPVAWSGRLFDESFQPISGARMNVKVHKINAVDSRDERSFEATLYPDGPAGHYSGTLAALEPGMYHYEGEAIAGQGQTRRSWRTDGDFWVETMGPEYFQLASSHRLLALLGRASGGSAFTPRDIALLAASIPKGFHRARLVSHVEMWNHWLLFASLASLLSVEWFIRRRRGLA